jgi:hypothetical protein
VDPLSARAVIATLLDHHVTPLLREHGFRRGGRTYRREQGGYEQLVDFQADQRTFTVSLGLFSGELYDLIHDGPLTEPAQEQHCFVRYRIGQIDGDGRVRPEPTRDDGWAFDQGSDLAALGAAVGERLRHNALRFFGHLATPAAIVAEIHSGRVTSNTLWLAAVAARAGDRAVAQQAMDRLRDGDPRTRRERCRIAAALGLYFPPPVDEEELIVTFRPPPGLSVQERESLFWSVVNELPRNLPAAGPSYFDRMRFPDDEHWDAHYYGPDAAYIEAALEPLLSTLAYKFAAITTRMQSL